MTTALPLAPLRDVLLRRSGLVFVEPAPSVIASEDLLRAFDIHLAELGYAMTHRLRARIAGTDVAALEALRAWTAQVLSRPIAAGQNHTPLFRRFPDDVPVDTWALWVRRVLVHFCQEVEQPCLTCGETGTTHVLSPCHHIVCDRCFDGSNYSGCPICNRKVDASPFFVPTEARALSPKEVVRMRLLDAGDDLGASVRELFQRFCARPQALSPTDRDDLAAIVRVTGELCIPWIPEVVPVRENRALILGTLFQHVAPAKVLPTARRMLTTATVVLRFVAVLSGRDGALQATAHWAEGATPNDPRWAEKTRKSLAAQEHAQRDYIKRYKTGAKVTLYQAVKTERYPVARLGRPLRRALLEVLEALPGDLRTEDMLRHRSLWTWVGELLHPHDYASRFPGAARSFEVVRGKLPDGSAAPPFMTYNARLGRAIAANDHQAFLAALRERPGELGRRYDHALRLAGNRRQAIEHTVEALSAVAERLSTPVLVTLLTHLPTRTKPAPVRLYWPKGALALGAQSPDRRPALRADAIAPAVRAVEAELLRRFARCGPVGDAVIDRALGSVVVPFNERTAGRSAVALPRGSRLTVPASKAIRLFLHWCEPKGGHTTDIDLSVGFYDDRWSLVGTCSYYNLTQKGVGDAVVARSSGDFTSAPPPDGASEFVDIDRAAARAAGYRYAAMIVNAYSGMAFSALERATAGVMLRDDLGGAHFDARTVELAFDLQGENGVYLPLVVDLANDALHWVDVYAPGTIAMNNVATSNRDVARLGPSLLAYFGSGERASMFDLGLLHAAARAERVTVRNTTGAMLRYTRRAGESAAGLLARLRAGDADGRVTSLGDLRAPVLGVLLRGDIALSEGARAYALFRERVTSPLSASDLLATPAEG